MWLAFALDGANFELSYTKWSMWPVLIFDIKFGAAVCEKEIFYMSVYIDIGQRSSGATKINVYLRPLLNELQQLWKGVPAQDFNQSMGS